jgi:hypothetical protein
VGTARAAQVALVVALSINLIGCGIIERLTGEAARKRARAEAVKEQSQTRQLKVMRFADQYVESIERRTAQVERWYLSEAAENLDVLVLRGDLARWQFTQATAAFEIAAGPNPTVNAVDMVVLVSLTRRIIQNQWVPLYGEPARMLLLTFQRQEEHARSLLDDVLTAEKLVELDQALQDWYESNPELETATFVRFTDIAGLGQAKTEADVSPGLLGVIGLDPLEGIDPALREVERTRMLAERSLYYAQRVPILFDMQVTQGAARIQASPAAREVLETVDQVGQLSEALSKSLDELPGMFAREREAAISQFMAELYDQQTQMIALTRELRSALDAGTVTAQSLEAMVNSTERLIARFRPSPAEPGSASQSRPFDINEYTRTVTELAATAREFQVLVQDLDSLAPKLSVPMEQLVGRVQGLIDYAFARVLIAILTAILGLLAVGILYQLAAARIRRSGQAAGPP